MKQLLHLITADELADLRKPSILAVQCSVHHVVRRHTISVQLDLRRALEDRPNLRGGIAGRAKFSDKFRCIALLD
jgi:hypothetical protein